MYEIMNTDGLLILLLCGVLVLAAIYDRRFHRIPNLLTYPTIFIGTAYHCLKNGLDGFLFSAGGLALGIGILFIPYHFGRNGGHRLTGQDLGITRVKLQAL